MKSFGALCLLLVGGTSAFSVTKTEPKEIRVKLGEPFTILCAVDGWYEYCTFKHAETSCNIDWKREPYNVTMGECSNYEGRVEFRGDYNNYECGLKITESKAEDSGDWTCEFEQYAKALVRGDGSTSKGTFKVIVDATTTTTTTTTATTTTASTSNSDYDYTYENDNSDKDEEDDAEESEAGSSTTEEDKPTADAQDQDDNTDRDGSPIIPIVIAVCLIILIGGLSIMFSQRWKPVMNNDDFPQQEDDEERHPSIIKNGGGADDTVLSEDGEKANINNDLTTVTYTDEKDEKEEKEEKKDDEKVLKDDAEKPEEKKEEKAEEKATE